MKTMKILFAVMIGCGLLWQACQKDEESMESYKDVETSLLKSDIEEFDCNVDCIDPDEPEYFIVHHELLIGWAGPDNNKFNKTVEVKFYNTLNHFIVKVMSTNGIADVLMDDESIKDFEGTIAPDEWYEFSFELEDNWQACDIWAFQLKISGFGPPAYFDVEYQLIGECAIVETYTLALTVSPDDAGTVMGQGEYMEGEEVALTATANEGYEFVNWTDEDDNIISYVADFTYTMPAMSKTLTANFEEDDVFICGVSTITDVDGNVYNTVLIGDQCWMAENLRVTRYHNNGAPVFINTGLHNLDWYFNISGAYAIYPHDNVDGINSDEEMVDAYGKLYNFFAVISNLGLCPEGWHVPTDEEWTDLVNYVESQGYPNQMNDPNGAGNALKSRRQVDNPLDGGIWATGEHPRWNSHHINHGLDVFGFSGLPGGRRRSVSGEYDNIGISGYWWILAEHVTGYPWYQILDFSTSTTGRFYDIRQYGCSVRCIKDDTSD